MVKHLIMQPVNTICTTQPISCGNQKKTFHIFKKCQISCKFQGQFYKHIFKNTLVSKSYHPTTNNNVNNNCPIRVIFGTNIIERICHSFIHSSGVAVSHWQSFDVPFSLPPALRPRHGPVCNSPLTLGLVLYVYRA